MTLTIVALTVGVVAGAMALRNELKARAEQKRERSRLVNLAAYMPIGSVVPVPATEAEWDALFGRWS